MVIKIEREKLLEQIDLNLPSSERVKRYLELVGDPYTIIVDGKKTRISFIGKKPLKQYFQIYFMERHIAG